MASCHHTPTRLTTAVVLLIFGIAAGTPTAAERQQTKAGALSDVIGSIPDDAAEASDWQRAMAQETVAGLLSYLRTWRTAPHVEQAKARVMAGFASTSPLNADAIDVIARQASLLIAPIAMADVARTCRTLKAGLADTTVAPRRQDVPLPTPALERWPSTADVTDLHDDASSLHVEVGAAPHNCSVIVSKKDQWPLLLFDFEGESDALPFREIWTSPAPGELPALAYLRYLGQWFTAASWKPTP